MLYTFVIGLVLLYLLLRLQSVQTYIAKELASYITEKSGIKIEINSLYISEFIKVDLKKVKAWDHHDKLFIDADRISLEVLPAYLLDDVLYIKDVQLDTAYFALIEYEGEQSLNLMRLIDVFSSDQPTDSTSSNLALRVENFDIHNSNFILDLQNMEHFEAMDYVHLNVSKINMSFSDLKIQSDSINVNIKHLSAYEKCGFELKEFKGQSLISPREIDIPDLVAQVNHSKAAIKFRFEYSEWSDWLDFINLVRFKSVIDSSNIYLDDLKYFSPELEGMNDMLNASGQIKGSIANLKLNEGSIYYGNSSFFNGDISVSGLPDIEQTFIRLIAKSAQFTNQDLNSFKLPGNASLNLGNELETLGDININGRFTGFYYDFVSNASFTTALGYVSTDISLQPTNNKLDFAYQGRVITKDFNLGKLLGTDIVQNISMDAKLKGTGLSSLLNAEYQMSFESIVFRGFEYNDLNINGVIANKKLNAFAESRYENFYFKANGEYDFGGSLPHIIMESKFKDAHVNRLFGIKSDTLGEISGNITLDIIGDELDNLEGYVKLDSVKYKYLINSYFADKVTFSTSIVADNNNRKILLRSPYLDADAGGFNKLSDLPKMYALLFNNILPKVVNTKDIVDVDLIEWQTSQVETDEQLYFDFSFKDTKNISDIFFPMFFIADSTSIKGNYSFKGDKLDISLKSNLVKYENVEAKNISLNLNKNAKELFYDMTTSDVHITENLALDSLNLFGYLYVDTASFNVQWGSFANTKNRGELIGNIHWNDTNNFVLSLQKGKFFIQDSIWTLKPDAQVAFKNHFIKVSDFEIYEKENNLIVFGQISDNPLDAIKINFNQFNLSFLDFYTKGFDIDMDGLVIGNVELSSIWNNPGFLSDFVVKDFKFNGVDLHEVQMNSLYSRSRKAIVLDMSIVSADKIVKNIDLGGFFYPYEDDNQLDVEVRVNKLPVKSIAPFLTSFTSHIEGYADGKLNLKGNLDKLVILGSLDADIQDVKIDYTNVHYKIKDRFIFTPEYFGFDNATAQDMKGNKLLLTTKIYHNYFQNFSLLVDVKPQNAQLLNTKFEDNELFYGKANGKGQFKMTGSFDALKLNIDLTPTGDANIAIPISSQSSATKSNFLTFLIKDSTLIKQQIIKEDELTLDLDIVMDIKQNSLIELVMDKKVGDVISARGDGKMHMTYEHNGDFNMYGNYVIEKGNYLFTMQNIINKRFVITPGSTILWDGEIEDAKINLRAVYKVEAKLWDLLQQIDSSDVYKKASKVNCIIDITGDLYNPKISFNIDLPDESVATRELVNRVLSADVSGNSEEMNKNFVSLLVIGTFQPPSGYQSGVNSNVLAYNATEMLAEQVGNLLNQLSDKVEIGMSWNPGDELTTQEVAVALSYSMLDDRLIIDGKFGTGGGSTSAESTRVVGDVNVEYKLTKDGRIRAKVFNRTNYYDPISPKSPYTQGIGIVFRKDFNNLRELFTSSKKSQTGVKNTEDKPIEKTKSKD